MPNKTTAEIINAETRKLPRDLVEDLIDFATAACCQSDLRGAFREYISDIIRTEIDGRIIPAMLGFMKNCVQNQKNQSKIQAAPAETDPALLDSVKEALPHARVITYQINERVCPYCGKKEIYVTNSSQHTTKSQAKIRRYACRNCGARWPSLEVFFTT